MSGKVRIGIVGTSWWADAMYLPALADHPLADVRGIVGGSRPDHTRAFAARWGIPGAYDAPEALFAAEPLDALLVLTSNKSHHPLVMAGLERGLHVLCEKPLGMTAAQAREMTEAAERVTQYAFQDLGWPHLWLSNAQDNHPSRRIKEKQGARLVDLMIGEHVGGRGPQMVWLLTRKDWMARHAA